MLYSLLITVIVLAAGYPIMGYFCFTKGYNTAAKLVEKPKIEAPAIPTLKSIKKKKERSQELKRIEKILANINAYDGTAVGQKEIK